MTEEHKAKVRINVVKASEANRRPKIEKPCEMCGLIMSLHASVLKDGGRFCSRKCRYTFMRGTKAPNAGNSTGIAGPKNPMWKGGKTRERGKHYSGTETKAWRNAVFSRDDYTCQRCNISPSGKLQAHHIKPWASYVEARFDVSNGVTLCIDCHYWVHGKKNLAKDFLSL